MILSLSYLVYSDVGPDVSSTVIRSFRYHNRKIMSSGLWNYQNTYCFIFSVDFLYWSLDSFCLSMVLKYASKSSSSPLKFQIDDMYAGRLKRPPHPSHPWWLLLPPRPPRPRSWAQLLVLDSLIVSWPKVFVVSTSPSLIIVADGSISVSGVVKFSFWTMLNSHYYSRSTWNITPHVCR